MELELGLKITRTRDDVTTSSDFRFTKDRVGPLFMSKETDPLFIHTAHLKGCKRESLNITINKDGTQLTISLEYPVEETVMVGWIMQKKQVVLRGFKKIFQIPEGVVLDRIKAKFDEQESILTILMPKSVKGIHGVGIEEIKEETAEKEDIAENQKMKRMEDEAGRKEEDNPKEEGSKVDEVRRNLEQSKEIVELVKEPEEKEHNNADGETQKSHEISETSDDTIEREPDEKENEYRSCELESKEGDKEKKDEEEDRKKRMDSKESKLCAPFVVVGSAILASLIAVVVHFVRAKPKTKS